MEPVVREGPGAWGYMSFGGEISRGVQEPESGRGQLGSSTGAWDGTGVWEDVTA